MNIRRTFKAVAVMVMMLSVSGLGVRSLVMAGIRSQRQAPEMDSSKAEPTGTRDAETVIGFARQHHPELATLLEQLRKAKSPEFGKAIRELSGQMNRLERIQERTPQRFEFELTVWKLESQTRLLLARWAMSQDPALEQQIRDLLRQRSLHRTTQLQQERQKLMDRLAVVEAQLEERAGNSELAIEEEWQRMSRRTGARKKSAAAGKTTVGKIGGGTPAGSRDAAKQAASKKAVLRDAGGESVEKPSEE